MIVDAHAHVYSEIRGITGSGVVAPLVFGKVQIGDAGVVRVLPPLATESRFLPEQLLEYMDDAGVHKAILLQAPFYGNANDLVRRAVATWPSRFAGLAYVDPFADGRRDEVLAVLEDGAFKGIKIEFTEATGFSGLYPGTSLGDSRLSWLWEEVAQRRMTVTLDLGPIGGPAYQTAAVRRLAESYADARWVVAHLGQPSPAVLASRDAEAEWLEQVRLAELPNVWLDIASLSHWFPEEDYPSESVGAVVRRARDIVGAEKLLWGTDVPGMLVDLTYQQMRDLVLRHSAWLTDAERALVIGENAVVAYRL